VRGRVKPRGNKKGRSDLNRNGLVLLATCFGLAFAMFSRCAAAVRAAFVVAIVPDNALAK
jgi:hypothetical protein